MKAPCIHISMTAMTGLTLFTRKCSGDFQRIHLVHLCWCHILSSEWFCDDFYYPFWQSLCEDNFIEMKRSLVFWPKKKLLFFSFKIGSSRAHGWTHRFLPSLGCQNNIYEWKYLLLIFFLEFNAIQTITLHHYPVFTENVITLNA